MRRAVYKKVNNRRLQVCAPVSLLYALPQKCTKEGSEKGNGTGRPRCKSKRLRTRRRRWGGCVEAGPRRLISCIYTTFTEHFVQISDTDRTPAPSPRSPVQTAPPHRLPARKNGIWWRNIPGETVLLIAVPFFNPSESAPSGICKHGIQRCSAVTLVDNHGTFPSTVQF